MPLPGPRPKPDSERRRRNAPSVEWTDVVDVPFVGAPRLPSKMPNGMAWPSFVRRWWKALSSMPHCRLWADSDWEFAYDTALLKAAFGVAGTPSLAAELRNRERVMGTTADFRRALRIRYIDPPTETDAPADVLTLDSYREL